MNSEMRQRYERELLESVIPFWEQHCVDTEYGGYFTSLDRDGSVYDTEKFMWMQWRIVYMFATLYQSPYRQDRWLTIARQGYDFLTAHGRSPNGAYYFALNREGVPSTAPYNIYTDCFACLGAAAMFAATGAPECRATAEAAMQTYRRRLDDPKGQWEKGLEGRPPRLTLGHYMMLANMGITMRDLLRTDAYDGDIRQAVEFVMDKFWNDEHQILFENLTLAGEVDLESTTGRMINPGHGLEALWFIMQYADESGREDLARTAAARVLAQLEFGWDREFGGIYYFMDVLGRPHVELHWDMKLWWVHCEALVAILYALVLSGDSRCEEWFARLDEWTWARFPDREYGEWFGYLNRHGEPTHRLKGGKWKTCFHLPRALYLCASLLQRQENQE